ncbi:MAG: hypothetical protein AB1689_05940 [Thermodesulfobacteriota bacterium]
MHARARSMLPTDRAFVVQLSAEADPGTRRLSGRVEHVVSGESVRFESLEQLLAFIAGMSGVAAEHD